MTDRDPTRFMRGDHLDPSNAMRAAERHLEAVTMSETKFTPGPWFVVEDERDGYEWNRHICWDESGNHRIAFMAVGAGTEANAHLIAAAPDLFDFALNVGGLSDRSLEHSGAFELRALIREYRAQARELLAQARGETA